MSARKSHLDDSLACPVELRTQRPIEKLSGFLGLPSDVSCISDLLLPFYPLHVLETSHHGGQE